MTHAVDFTRSQVMRILVGSKNPVKVEATREAFSNFFSHVVVKGQAVPSGVPDQPVGEETFRGAHYRAEALSRDGEADFFVGIEGGIFEVSGCWFALGAMCVRDARGRVGWGTSPLFPLPVSLVVPLREGVELGTLIDALSGQRDTKRAGGAVGYFTRGALDRKSFYVQGLTMALIPFLHEALFFES